MSWFTKGIWNGPNSVADSSARISNSVCILLVLHTQFLASCCWYSPCFRWYTTMVHCHWSTQASSSWHCMAVTHTWHIQVRGPSIEGDTCWSSQPLKASRSLLYHRKNLYPASGWDILQIVEHPELLLSSLLISVICYAVSPLVHHVVELVPMLQYSPFLL
jgi:hypothetical protein